MLWPMTPMGPAANWPAKLLPRVLFSWLRLLGEQASTSEVSTDKDVQPCHRQIDALPDCCMPTVDTAGAPTR